MELLVLELEVETVEAEVELVELELLVELIEVLVLEVEVLEVDVELVEVVVPVGKRKKVAITQTHWIEAFAPKIAACTPPVVTNRSSAATAITSGAPAETRLT